MLEQRQTQLVAALQEMYRRLLWSHAWTGPACREVSGNAIWQDILAALDLQKIRNGTNCGSEKIEEGFSKLQTILSGGNAGSARGHRSSSLSYNTPSMMTGP